MMTVFTDCHMNTDLWQQVYLIRNFVDLCFFVFLLLFELDSIQQVSELILEEDRLVFVPYLENGFVVCSQICTVVSMDCWPLVIVDCHAEDFALKETSEFDSEEEYLWQTLQEEVTG